MTRLADLELLVRAADLGSLTAAARALDWSPAAASAALKRVEERMGAPLFLRSTRSLRLTPEGERFLPHARQALEVLEQGRAGIVGGAGTVQGELQVSMPSDLGRNLLLPWLDAFQQAHPALGLRLHVSDRAADMLRRPIGASFRYGVLPASNLIALPLSPDNHRVLVASPAYLRRHGTPATARELRQHTVLRVLVRDAVPDTWRLRIDGRWQDVAVAGSRVADDGEIVTRWALAGLGIACKSWLDVAAELARGRLVRVNPEWRGEASPLHLVVPGRGQLTPAVRALHAWLQPRFAAMVPGS